MIADYFLYSVKNLRKRKLRSWLTISGIFIAIATIFLLLGLSLGLSNAINEQFKILGSDKFFIMPKGMAGAPGSGGAVELTTDDVNVISKISGVKATSYLLAGNAKLEFNLRTRYYLVAAFPKENVNLFFEAGGLKIEDGKPVEKAKKMEVALGNLYKTGNLFGKPINIGDTIKINGVEVKIISILATVGNPSDDQNIYMFLDTYEEIFGKTNRVDTIYVQIQPGENIKDIADKAKTKLLKFRGLTEKTRDFEILTPEELLASFSVILNIITAFLVGIGAISLLVGGIGIMNTMYTSVLERTNEIGTMKAVGARNSDILKIFLIESGLLGLVGGIIGILIGYIGGKLVEIIAAPYTGTLLQVYFPWYLTLSVLAFSFLIGSLSGILPSYRASKLKPVDALRYE
ncbi:ABC transporter permease [Candidatus Pacearchaeota archaeon]|nr:ABC transporter permease [Candidatus Pacearchaeota archaeon]